MAPKAVMEKMTCTSESSGIFENCFCFLGCDLRSPQVDHWGTQTIDSYAW